MFSRTLIFVTIICFSLCCEAFAASVSLEIRGGTADATSFHQWGRALSEAGITGFRFSTGGAAKVDVESSGNFITVHAIISNGKLVVPGRSFSIGSLKGLKTWIDDLEKNGVGEDGSPQPVAKFGLTADQFASAMAAFRKPVNFPTKGISALQITQKVLASLPTKVALPQGAIKAIGNELTYDELNGMSSGSALSALLRPFGYCLTVERAASGDISYVIIPMQPDTEIWPVGWTIDTREWSKTLPKLYERKPVNIVKYPIGKMVEGIAKHINVPVVYDWNLLVRKGINPAKTLVSYPKRQTNEQTKATYYRVISSTTFSVKMKMEIRTDENGQPLLWMTVR